MGQGAASTQLAARSEYAAAFPENRAHVRHIAERNGVDYAVEGSVRKARQVGHVPLLDSEGQAVLFSHPAVFFQHLLRQAQNRHPRARSGQKRRLEPARAGQTPTAQRETPASQSEGTGLSIPSDSTSLPRNAASICSREAHADHRDMAVGKPVYLPRDDFVNVFHSAQPFPENARGFWRGELFEKRSPLELSSQKLFLFCQKTGGESGRRALHRRRQRPVKFKRFASELYFSLPFNAGFAGGKILQSSSVKRLNFIPSVFNAGFAEGKILQSSSALRLNFIILHFPPQVNQEYKHI